MNIRAIDLNLLGVLDALLTERSVTRAAKSVHLSQPAASNALARLRHLLKDPLLVRGSGGLVLTARAQELVEPVKLALIQIELAFRSAEPFNPATSNATFTIAALDAVEVGVLPRLFARLQKDAPGVNVVCRPLPSLAPTANPIGSDVVPERSLASGELDVAIGCFADRSPRFHAEVLFDGGYLCAVRKDHPLIKRKLTLSRFLAASHVVVVTPANEDIDIVDVALSKLQISRRVIAVVPHFTIVPYLITQSDFIATLPERVANKFAQTFPLRLFEPPLTLPKFNISQVWHERTHHSPAHRWLRTAIAESGAMLKSPRT